MVHKIENCEEFIVDPNLDIADPNLDIADPNLDIPDPNLDIVDPNLDIADPNLDIPDPSKQKSYVCIDCCKTFSTKSNLSKHTKSRCKGVANSLQCPYCNVMYSSYATKSRHVKTCKEKKVSESVEMLHVTNQTSTQLQTNIRANTVNQMNIGTQNVTIHINAFGKEDLSHITDEYKDMCIRAINGAGVKMMVHKTHFDTNMPQNNNVKVKSSKQQQMQIWDNHRWAIRDSNETADAMMMRACKELLNHYYESPIKNEDIIEHASVMLKNLVNIRQRNPPIYHSLRRQVLAMISDATMKMLEQEL